MMSTIDAMDLRGFRTRGLLSLCAVGAVVAWAACSKGGAQDGTGGSGATVGTAGHAGAAPACTVAGECPGIDQDCAHRVCEAGVCGVEFAPAATPCHGTSGDACDGDGGCLFADGAACVDGLECLSGTCTDLVCCTAACLGVCQGCAASGDGSCTIYAAGTDPDGECGGGVCDGQSACASGAYRWSKTYATTGIKAVAADDAGNVIIAGAYTGQANVGCGPLPTAQGPFDGFVAKLDPTGACLWQARWGGAAGDLAEGVAVDPDGNVLVVGWFQGAAAFPVGPHTSTGAQDIFVLKLDAQGNGQWDLRFGGNDQPSNADYGLGIVADSSGAMFITGQFGAATVIGNALTPMGGKDAFVAKIDGAGTPLWSKAIATPGVETIVAPTLDAAGDVYVAGTFDGVIDFGDGGLAAGAGANLWYLKVDSAGISQFWQSRGNDQAISVASVSVTSDGRPFVSGGFRDVFGVNGATELASGGGIDDFVVHVHSTGYITGGMGWGDAADQWPLVIAHDAKDDLLLAGGLIGSMDFGGGPLTSAGSADVVVAKLDPAGAHLWSQRFGATNNQQAAAVTSDPDGNVLVVGTFAGTIDFGGGPVTAAGNNDGFVVSLGP